MKKLCQGLKDKTHMKLILFIPIFTDISEYKEGKEKISTLFLDKLTCKVLSAEDIEKLAGDDENFRGLVINPHSQNFMMDRNGGF